MIVSRVDLGSSNETVFLLGRDVCTVDTALMEALLVL